MSTKHFLLTIRTLLFTVLTLFNFTTFAEDKTLLVYGDSLSAAYGLDQKDGWVALLEEKIVENFGSNMNVVNASISGETSSGGKARLARTLDEFNPQLVFLELGANDGLRGQSIAQIESNLSIMAEQIRERGAQLVVFGITLPPSYGPRYVNAFQAIFERVANQSKGHYFNFVVDEFIGKDNFIQPDGLHPTAAAQPIIMERVWQFIQDKSLLGD